MNVKSLWISAAILLGCLAAPQAALSADVAVIYTVDSSQNDGETVHGTMTVQVLNLTQAALLNVDLRQNYGGGIFIGRDVLQVGNVDAAQVSTIFTDFRLEQGLFDMKAALPLLVDFDDELGTHHSLAVSAMRGN